MQFPKTNTKNFPFGLSFAPSGFFIFIWAMKNFDNQKK